MAFFMVAGSEPQTDRQREDLYAIAALNESAVIELKVNLLLLDFSCHPFRAQERSN
ncbi:hypothetical protein MA16_Dca008886 [Dendrobium catenatum]|uniref:Uncharacterized protein n=1 Tax=Dendrobium catenatum TaxID=906689 RepID=A0A2I0VUL0_9ASPA|nr:hypothetical protein MA16_Dca008886 [Dendrobium catenatum]